jgi:hypothetical protein
MSGGRPGRPSRYGSENAHTQCLSTMSGTTSTPRTVSTCRSGLRRARSARRNITYVATAQDVCSRISIPMASPMPPRKPKPSVCMPTSRIGTTAFHANSHQAKCTQPRRPKGVAGRSARPGVSVTASMVGGGGLSQVYTPRIHCPHASRYLGVCRSRRGFRASLTERERDVDTPWLRDTAASRRGGATALGA